MGRVLPIGYALVLVAELLALSTVYAMRAPSASDPLSVWLGWGALASMVVMLIYSVARRSKRLRRWARLSWWLHLHIFLGLQGVLWAFFHSLPLFTRTAAVSWLNPGVLNLVAVAVVFFSGIFGRYLYSWLPRTLGGEQMAARDVEAEIAASSTPLPAEVEALWKEAPAGGGFLALVAADRRTRQALRELDRLDLPPELRDLARRRVWLARRSAALARAQRWFRNWILLHRPIAAIMYILTAVHVVLAYMFSPTLGR